MWIKDSMGNWFLSGKPLISEENDDQAVWRKDGNGNWYMVSKTLKKDPSDVINNSLAKLAC